MPHAINPLYPQGMNHVVAARPIASDLTPLACDGCGTPDTPAAPLPYQIQDDVSTDLYCQACHDHMRQDEAPAEAVMAALVQARLHVSLTPAELRDALQALLEASDLQDTLLRGTMTGLEPRQAAALN